MSYNIYLAHVLNTNILTSCDLIYNYILAGISKENIPMKKKTALLIALLLVLQSFASCADNQQDETTGETTATAASETTAEETESENPYYDGYVDPFVDTDLGGETLTIYNSVN